MSYTFNPFTGNLDVTPFSLDGAGKIPSNYLPSYVDDVVEYDDLAGFPGTGETGKIYVAKDTGYTYRWTGSVYVRIGSGGEVGLNLGSEGSPSLFFNGDANTGLYSPGADQVAISTSGTERLRIDSSGNVGIGTSSPSNLLDVDGTAVADRIGVKNTSPTAALHVIGSTTGQSTGAAYSAVRIVGSSSAAPNGGGLTLGGYWNNVDVNGRSAFIQSSQGIDAGSTARSLLLNPSGGNVGIGTTSPGDKLEIKGDNGGYSFRVDAETAPVTIRSEDNTGGAFGAIRFTAGNGSGTESERLRIDSSGRLLVGTSFEGHPNADNLTLADSGDCGITIRSSTTNTGAIYFADSTSGGGKFDGFIEYNQNSRFMRFATAQTERMRIDSSGNVGIGTSSPGGLLHVQSNLAGNNQLILTNIASSNSGAGSEIVFTQGASGFAAGKIQCDREGSYSTTTTAQDSALAFFTAADGVDSEKLRITSAGRVGIGTTSPSNSLDIACDVGNGIRIGSNAAGLITRETEGLRITGSSTNKNISFVTAGSEACRIDTSGRLLVGTSSTSGISLVQIQGYSGAATGVGLLELKKGSTTPADGDALGALYFSDSGSNRGAQITGIRDGGTWTSGSSQPGRLVFSTTADGASSPTERMRITSDAYVRLASGTGGIQFNGDTAAANALDDYEEGTWSPVYTPTSGSFATMTMFVQSARYTKIGNLVTAEAYIVTSNVDVTGASGSVNITGLPFTSYSAQTLRRSGAIGYSGIFAAYPVSWAIAENTTTINLYEARGDELDVADLSTGASSANIIWLSVSYIAA